MAAAGQGKRHRKDLQFSRGLILNLYRRPCSFYGVIPEIDIWRPSQLILKRYGDKALEESTARADELAVAALANTTTSGPVH
jgi:hypothetical protein